MKIKIFLFIILLFSFLLNNGQNSKGSLDDISRIALAPVVSSSAEVIPSSARDLFLTKLTQIVTANAMGANNKNSRFVITGKINVITKDVLPGPPPQIALTLDVTLFVADMIDHKIFSTTTISVKGVGNNEDKAYISGLKTINAQNPKIKEFVEAGSSKIIEYYNSSCDFIIKNAQTLAAQKRYEESMYVLMSVPDVCKDCYNKCMDIVPDIFKKYSDYLCQVNLAKAKAAWSSNPNVIGANDAASYLGNITPDAACYKDAQNLVSEIKGKLLADEKKAWDFEVKKWDDGVSIDKQLIEAYRQVGVAYGENQKPATYDVSWIVK